MTTHRQCLRKNAHEPHEWPGPRRTYPLWHCFGRRILPLPYPIDIKHLRICEDPAPHVFHNWNHRIADHKFQVKACPGWEYAGPKPPADSTDVIHNPKGVEPPVVEDKGDFWWVEFGGYTWNVPKPPVPFRIEPGPLMQLPPPPEPIISPKQVRQLMGFLREIARDVNYLADQKGKEIESGQ